MEFGLLFSAFPQRFLHESFEMGVNYQLHFAISIWYQFFTQALILYSTYNVVVRYIYVYNHRIILENYSDELLRKLIFVLTSLVSGIICLISYANDMRAEQYILVKGSSEIPFTRMEHIYRILLSISIAVNFVLAVALKRKVGNWEEEDEAKAKVSTMKKIFTVLVLMTAITTLRFVLGKKSPYVVPTMGAICVDISLIIYILSKDPLKKFVKKKCLEIFNVSCSSSVSPSPTKI